MIYITKTWSLPPNDAQYVYNILAGIHLDIVRDQVDVNTS